MPADLKKNVINMKHLSQDIDDPIVVNAADANGRTLEIIFTQEAAAQLTPNTKVYLSWYHQQQKIKGYNVFTYVPGDNPKRDPYRWTIFYPQSMLYCGDVLACIEIVDDVSIAASNNFMIHVLEDPNDGSTFVVTDDFSEFKKAIIDLTTFQDNLEEEWAQMQEEHQFVLQAVEDFREYFDTLDERITALEQKDESWTEAIEQAKQEAIEQADIDSEITITKVAGTTSDDFLYRYTVNQGGEPIENGIIDVYKGLMVTGGTLIHPTPQEPIEIDGQEITSGTYIQINLTDGNPVYIDVADLIEYNIFNDTGEILVTDDEHSIWLGINKISANKIIYKPEIWPWILGSYAFFKDSEDGSNAFADDTSEILTTLYENFISENDIINVDIGNTTYEYYLHEDLSSLPQFAYLYPIDDNNDFGRIYLTQEGRSDIACPQDWEGGYITFSLGERQHEQTVMQAINELQNTVLGLTWNWLTPSP